MTKPSAPHYRKISYNATDTECAVAEQMAIELGEGISTAEVVRRSLRLTRVILHHYATHPEAPEALLISNTGSDNEATILIPVRALLELPPAQRPDEPPQQQA